MRIFFPFLLFFTVFLFAQDVTIQAGKWNLLATTSEVNIRSDASSSCNIFGFDYNTQSYINHTADQSNIAAGKAIFVYAKSTACTIKQTQMQATTTTVATNGPMPDADVPVSSATYRLTFQTLWSSATHPKEYPAGAHFSKLVVMFGDESTAFFESGTTATAGVKLMAETGSTGVLSDEINALDNTILKIGSNAATPSSTSVDITTTSKQPYLSFSSMLAPSPDWFVGIDRLLLFEGSSWIGSKNVDLLLYDAGTDDGEGYTSANAPTSPRGKIERFTSSRLGFDNGAPKVGILKIEKIK